MANLFPNYWYSFGGALYFEKGTVQFEKSNITLNNAEEAKIICRKLATQLLNIKDKSSLVKIYEPKLAACFKQDHEWLNHEICLIATNLINFIQIINQSLTPNQELTPNLKAYKDYLYEASNLLGLTTINDKYASPIVNDALQSFRQINIPPDFKDQLQSKVFEKFDIFLGWLTSVNFVASVALKGYPEETTDQILESIRQDLYAVHAKILQFKFLLGKYNNRIGSN